MTSWSLNICTQKKNQIEKKVIIVFIENWKEVGPWFWLVWIAWWLFLILAIFRGQTGVKVGPKNQTLDTFCHCKNLIFSKCFKWNFYNYEDYLWSKFLLSLMLFTGVIATNPSPPRPQKWVQLDPEPKKCTCFFWVKSRTANTQNLKLSPRKV